MVLDSKTLVELRFAVELAEVGARAAIDRYEILGDADSAEGAKSALAEHRDAVNRQREVLSGLQAFIEGSSVKIEAQWSAARLVVAKENKNEFQGI